LQELLLQKKTQLVDRWFQRVLETYPTDTAKYLRQEPDRFQNPVGQTVAPALKIIFAILVQGFDVARLQSSLDDIIRIRAVQDFSASQAVGFLFQLKQVIRDELENQTLNGTRVAELAALETRIDEAALLAFDIYMQCREQIFAIKNDRLKRETSLLLERSQKAWKGGNP
jgi:hypothetical protein